MAQHCIKGKRIRRVCIPKEYDIDKIQIGIPVICDEAKKVGLIKNGDVVLPSGIFGAQCRRNAYGYSYADKSKPKERRYVSTNWVHPFGNTNASEVAVDIYRPCWPQVEVPPYGIELQLFKSKDGQLYVIVVLTDEIRANYLKEAVNILLEIYGVCYIFDGEIQLDYSSKRQKCNWEMLPPGEMPSRHIKKQLGERGEKTDTYDIFRLEYMEKYNSEKIVEGINGFKGYYAFIFSKCCVLESAIYGKPQYMQPFLVYPISYSLEILTLFSREMQVIITEMMLWDAWYYTKKYGTKDKPFVVVLDEAQNLSHTMKSPSAAILTEGRKFGWSAWFATQSLKVLKDDEVVRLLQASFKLYFKPTDDEMVKISKQIDATGEGNWLGVIQGLQKGQCIVVGDRMLSNGKVGAVSPVVTRITSFQNRI